MFLWVLVTVKDFVIVTRALGLKKNLFGALTWDGILFKKKNKPKLDNTSNQKDEGNSKG